MSDNSALGPRARAPARAPEARRVQRVKQMLDACAQLIDEVGYDGLTTTMVAERAGVAIRSVYHLFPDKLAIVRHVAKHNADEYLDRLRGRLSRERPSGALAAVDVVIDEYIEMYRTVPGFRSLRFGDAVDRRLLDSERDNHVVVGEWIADLVDDVYNPTGERPEIRHGLVTRMTRARMRIAFLQTSGHDDGAFSEMRTIVRELLRRMLRPTEPGGLGGHTVDVVRSPFQPAVDTYPGMSGLVDVYLTTDDEEAARHVFRAVDALAALLGFEGPAEEEIRTGSIWRLARSTLRPDVGVGETKRQSLAVLRVFGGRPDPDSVLDSAVYDLIAELATVGDASVLLPPDILILRYADDPPVLNVLHLSRAEMEVIAADRTILSEPRQTLRRLAVALDAGCQRTGASTGTNPPASSSFSSACGSAAIGATSPITWISRFTCGGNSGSRMKRATCGSTWKR